MSMTVITVLQITGIYCAYLLITVFLPHFAFGKTVRFKNRYERFLFYVISGNFYMINLVYLLELVHISYRLTLILFTVVPAVIIKVRLERIPLGKYILDIWDTLRKLTGGQLKVKNVSDQIEPLLAQRRKKFFAKIKKVYLNNIVDALLTLTLLLCILYFFGSHLLKTYGYKASDLIVHNYWINSLSENRLFCAGIYPFGFHNTVYYIHKVFGIDTVALLRTFSLHTVTFNILMLFCALKLLCKSRYIPYIGAFMYSVVDCFLAHTYGRYNAPLPQEYGIMFIFPAIYCGFAYFRAQRREKRGLYSKDCYRYLAGFAMSFSLCITTHFYGVMAAGIFAFSMATGFAVWLFRKTYFKRVMCTIFITMGIALTPMFLAAAEGIEIEGSLRWGLSIIFGVKGDDDADKENTETEEQTEIVEEVTEEVEEVEEEVDRTTRLQRFIETYSEKYGSIAGPPVAYVELLKADLSSNVFKEKDQSQIYVVLIGYGTLLVLGVVIMLGKRDKIYGAVLLSTGIHMVVITTVLCAGDIGIPMLMDPARASIYVAYSAAFAIPMFVDAVMYFILGWGTKKKYVLSIASFTLLAFWGGMVIRTNYIRKPLSPGGMETNGAVECLTRISMEEEDYSWTICSANDEGRMVYDHGFHYELIDFLRGMEYVADKGRVRMPTKYVYIFVEKIPIDYFATYWGSGQSVSRFGAKRDLPLGRSLGLYTKANRWICMSRLYYWAQAFMELYPNEMSVYYETDNFVCYKIIQNPYRLFNFAIDYEYNSTNPMDVEP
ncbi:MAG: hypothetical protein K6A74_05395 [Lachnospiraceae bacterium]|nr:hypothetical protein [Lachnospiraceae bacterium]